MTPKQIERFSPWVLLLAVLLLVAGCQNRLLYQPHRGSEEDEIAAEPVLHH